MENKKKIKLKSIKDPVERDILTLLKKKGECIYGEIIKELKISSARGQQATYSLITAGYIRHKNRTSKLKLNVEIQ